MLNFKNQVSILLILLYLVQNTLQYGIQCYSWIDSYYYSLHGLKSTTQNVGLFEDGQIVAWNTCGNYVKAYDNVDSYFVYKNGDDDELYLAGDSIDSFTLVEENKPRNGININFKISDYGFSFTLTILCDYDNQQVEYFDPPVEESEGHYTMKISHESGCAKIELSQIWTFLSENKLFFIPVLLGIGLLNCFFGLKYFKETLAACGFLVGFFVILLIFSEIIMGFQLPDYINYVVLLVSVCGGAFIAKFCYYLESAGFFFIGALGGFIIGTILYQTFIHQFITHQGMVYFTYTIFLISGGIIGYFVKKHVSIFMTSFIGSYLVVRSISFIIEEGKYFPNEFTLAQMVDAGDFEFPMQFYIFLAGIIGLFIFGCIVQYKIVQEEGGEEAGQEYIEKLLNKDENSNLEKSQKNNNKNEIEMQEKN